MFIQKIQIFVNLIKYLVQCIGEVGDGMSEPCCINGMLLIVNNKYNVLAY